MMTDEITTLQARVAELERDLIAAQDALQTLTQVAQMMATTPASTLKAWQVERQARANETQLNKASITQLTRERDEARAVAERLSHRAEVQRRDPEQTALYWVCLHCQHKSVIFPLLTHAPDCPVTRVRAWDEKPLEDE